MGSGGALDPQGPVAEITADLWWLMLWLGVAVFVVFAILLARALVRDRASDHVDPADDRHADPDEPRVARWLWGWGVVGPGIVLVVVFGATVAAMVDLPMRATTDDALVVQVVGRQFSYEVTYPESGVVVTNELHLPVDREVELRLTSADVIHSFWVPELGGKVDMMPDRINTMVVQADRAGEHRLRCAEFCGLDHAGMVMPVIVEPAADFEAWLTRQVGGGEPTDDDDG